jgi:BON domain
MGDLIMGDRDRYQQYYDRNEERYSGRDDSPYREQQRSSRDWEGRNEQWRTQNRERSFRDDRDFGERSYGQQYQDRPYGGGYGQFETRRFPGTFGSYEDQRYNWDEDRYRRFEGERGYENRDRDLYGQRSRQYGMQYGMGEGYYGRGPQRDRDESWGQQLRDVGQQMMRKVKRVFRAPKGYKRSDDRIREDVNDRLAQDDQLDPSEIEVSVSNGEVTLAGSVESRHEKFLAEEIADDVGGVSEVHNQLRVTRARTQQGLGTSAAEAGTTTAAGGQAATEAARNRNARAQ